MSRFTLAKSQLFELALDRSSARFHGYRFGRISAKSVVVPFRRIAGSVRELSRATLRIVAAAKLRRIEREFRIRGPNHDWLRIDDDHFTPVDR